MAILEKKSGIQISWPSERFAFCANKQKGKIGFALSDQSFLKRILDRYQLTLNSRRLSLYFLHFPRWRELPEIQTFVKSYLFSLSILLRNYFFIYPHTQSAAGSLIKQLYENIPEFPSLANSRNVFQLFWGKREDQIPLNPPLLKAETIGSLLKGKTTGSLLMGEDLKYFPKLDLKQVSIKVVNIWEGEPPGEPLVTRLSGSFALPETRTLFANLLKQLPENIFNFPPHSQHPFLPLVTLSSLPFVTSSMLPLVKGAGGIFSDFPKPYQYRYSDSILHIYRLPVWAVGEGLAGTREQRGIVHPLPTIMPNEKEHNYLKLFEATFGKGFKVSPFSKGGLRGIFAQHLPQKTSKTLLKLADKTFFQKSLIKKPGSTMPVINSTSTWFTNEAANVSQLSPLITHHSSLHLIPGGVVRDGKTGIFHRGATNMLFLQKSLRHLDQDHAVPGIPDAYERLSTAGQLTPNTPDISRLDTGGAGMTPHPESLRVDAASAERNIAGQELDTIVYQALEREAITHPALGFLISNFFTKKFDQKTRRYKSHIAPQIKSCSIIQSNVLKQREGTSIGSFHLPMVVQAQYAAPESGPGSIEGELYPHYRGAANIIPGTPYNNAGTPMSGLTDDYLPMSHFPYGELSSSVVADATREPEENLQSEVSRPDPYPGTSFGTSPPGSIPGGLLAGLADRVYDLIVERVKRERGMRGY